MLDIEWVQLTIAQYLTRAYKVRKENFGAYHSRVGQTLRRIDNNKRWPEKPKDYSFDAVEIW